MLRLSSAAVAEDVPNGAEGVHPSGNTNMLILVRWHLWCCHCEGVTCLLMVSQGAGSGSLQPAKQPQWKQQHWQPSARVCDVCSDMAVMMSVAGCNETTRGIRTNRAGQTYMGNLESSRKKDVLSQ